ncbi:MAG TPA: ABC transporter ATP-binding protein/permease [Candidatus Ruminococcus avistercoris]|nr:ABC transporter ATP-binding protein/permease [Candidatus Ruminococcus avistercoris]
MIKKRLIGLLAHGKKYIVFQVLWQWFALLCQVLIIYAVAMTLDGAVFGTLTERRLAIYACLGAGGMALRFFCDRQAAQASFAASMDVKRILREQIYRKLLRLGASYREGVSTSEVVQMAAEGVEQLETYFGKYLPQLFYSLAAPVTLFVILSFVNWQASLVLLVCVPLIPVSIVAVQKIAGRLLKRYWGIYTELGDSFLENLQGLTTLKIYQCDGIRARKMDEEAQRFRQITMKVLMMQLNSTSVMDIIAYGGAAAGMIVTVCQFCAGHVGLGGALMLILLASEFFIPLRLLGSFFHIAMNGMAASDRIFALLDLPEPQEQEGKIQEERVNITMFKVRFSYEPDREILKGIHMNFPAGSFTSLVGLSGSGKSTVAGLLTGRNKGYEGSITAAGMELSRVSEASLMDTVTMVSHNSYLFKGTVEENLRMGKENASDEELEEVLREVRLYDFLHSRQGLGTAVAERGENFSGGQRQRLALARALLHDTPVYIFDEATSNIDMESEEMIMDVIHRLAKKKTVILISHRLANVVKSDRIYLLEQGKVVQWGNHDALMAQEGPYRELFQHQQELENYGRRGRV